MSTKKPHLLPNQDNPMLGTWEWHSGLETFRLVLQREAHFKTPDGKVYNVILGTHKYIKNNIITENSIEMSGVDGNPAFTLFGSPTSSNKLVMSFHDQTKNKQGKVLLELVSGKSDKMHWRLFPPSETVSINKPIPTGYTVPTTLVLTRVR
jgi:hypothetical protein